MKKAKSRLKQKTFSKLTWALIITTCCTTIAIATLFGWIARLNEESLLRLKSHDLAIVIQAKKQIETISYTPSSKTIALINRNPDLASKIKNVFGEKWTYAAELIARESSFNSQAINPSSGACGLFQAYPCEKMKCQLSDEDCQLNWGHKYITQRYHEAESALNFHKNNGWY